MIIIDCIGSDYNIKNWDALDKGGHGENKKGRCVHRPLRCSIEYLLQEMSDTRIAVRMAVRAVRTCCVPPDYGVDIGRA